MNMPSGLSGIPMHIPFRVKIIAGTALVVMGVLVAGGTVTHRYFTQVVSEQGVKDGRTKLALVSAGLTRLQEQAAKTARYIATQEEIASIPKDDSTESYFKKVAFQETLKKYTALNEYVLNILILREDGMIFSNNSGYESYFQASLDEEWYRAYQARGKRTGFTGVHRFFALNREQLVFSYIMEYRDAGDGMDFVLILDIKLSEIENAFREGALGFESVALFGAEGVLLFASGEADEAFEVLLAAAASGQEVEDARRIVILDTAMHDGWVQAAALSKESLFLRVDEVLGVYLFVLAATVALILSIFLPWAINITRPVAILTAAMRRASSGDLSVRVDIRTGDDIQTLADGFNRMASDLDRFVAQSLEREKLERRMEIGLLMAQVNPHFLYNTLNTVIYLCGAARADAAADISRSLISILQASLKDGHDVFLRTIEEELEVVDRYLEIQSFRYPGRFAFMPEVAAEALSALVPRMSLQPLVENALFHGIGPLGRSGVIRLSALRDGEHIQVKVSDDGVGMGEDELAAALLDETERAEAATMTRIGLRNIRDRIHYHFGPSYGLSLRSAPGQGTTATLILPFRQVTES